MGFLAGSNRNLQLRHCWEMLMPGAPSSHQQQPTMASACRGTDLNVSMHAHARVQECKSGFVADQHMCTRVTYHPCVYGDIQYFRPALGAGVS